MARNVERLNDRHAAGPGPDDDPPVCRGDISTAAKALIERKEAGENAAGKPIEHADDRHAARVGADDDFGPAIAVEIRARDGDAAGEIRIECDEVANERLIGAAEDLDARRAARAGPDNNVI